MKVCTLLFENGIAARGIINTKNWRLLKTPNWI
jgi:hypothetical protein